MSWPFKGLISFCPLGQKNPKKLFIKKLQSIFVLSGCRRNKSHKYYGMPEYVNYCEFISLKKNLISAGVLYFAFLLGNVKYSKIELHILTSLWALHTPNAGRCLFVKGGTAGAVPPVKNHFFKDICFLIFFFLKVRRAFHSRPRNWALSKTQWWTEIGTLEVLFTYQFCYINDIQIDGLHSWFVYIQFNIDLDKIRYLFISL